MFNLEVLQLVIYFVFIGSIIAYATLDGFDLGVGSLHLFAKTDEERRLMINAIGPVWDGNTTWIVVGGGVLFAGFPKVFGSLMSGLYTPVMMLIFGFMLRGAAVEFRSKEKSKRWRSTWDICFSGASLLLALVLGLALGNFIQGIPIDAKGNIQCDMLDLLKPYPVLVSLFALSLFMMHGSIFLLMKTEGAFQHKIRRWAKRLVILFLLLWTATTVTTLVFATHMIHPILKFPFLGTFALMSFLSIGILLYALKKAWYGVSFIFSCLSILCLIILFVIGTFPNFAYSTIDPAFSLTLYNSSVTETALLVLTIVSLSGFPLTFFYGAYLYR
ncbi:MAG: cytochrome d ubiquinol oxidase subunit II, partial [Chlamydiales bacterium]